MSLLNSLQFIASHPLNKSQRGRALLRVLKWQTASRLISGQMVFEWVSNTRFLVRRGETGLTGNVYCGLHEFSEMAFVLHVLGEDDCFVDVGANVGSYTILACGARKATGYCFEPVPATFERLMDNLRLNDLGDRVIAYNMGLSDIEAELEFSIDQDCMNHVIREGEKSLATARVRVAPLDLLMKGVAPSLLKIDVEGFEARVLRGANETLGNVSLHSVVMEVNQSGKHYGEDDADLLAIMKGHGFDAYQYDPFSRSLAAAVSGSRHDGNCIFVRDLDRVRGCIERAPKFEIHGHYL